MGFILPYPRSRVYPTLVLPGDMQRGLSATEGSIWSHTYLRPTRQSNAVDIYSVHYCRHTAISIYHCVRHLSYQPPTLTDPRARVYPARVLPGDIQRGHHRPAEPQEQGSPHQGKHLCMLFAEVHNFFLLAVAGNSGVANRQKNG